MRFRDRGHFHGCRLPVTSNVSDRVARGISVKVENFDLINQCGSDNRGVDARISVGQIGGADDDEEVACIDG